MIDVNFTIFTDLIFIVVSIIKLIEEMKFSFGNGNKISLLKNNIFPFVTVINKI